MKMYYTQKPEMSPVESQNWMKLDSDWSFFIDDKPIWIPKDYYYDGASIPRLFWSVIGSPFEPDLQAPALAHDWLYLTHLTDRATADETIFQLMTQATINTIRTHLIWGAVRGFASFAWTNNAKDVAELVQLRKELLLRPDGRKFCI